MLHKSWAKRVGVLTLPLKDNYGGILQAVALYGYLDRIGCQPVLIRKEFYHPLWKRLLIKCLEMLPVQNFKKFRSVRINSALHKPFIDSAFPRQTRFVVTKEELKAVVQESNLDAVVVGSDQVWRMQYIDKVYYGAYFLDFLESSRVRRVSFSASFGVDHWEYPEKANEVKHWLAAFDAVSVRETSGLALCEEFGRTDAVHVLDPTLLVGLEFYESMIQDIPDAEHQSFLYYVLDESSFSESLLDDLLSELNGSGGVERIYEKHNAFQTYSIAEWVKAFSDASFVLTDSFHGMLFSVLYNKPFVVIANKKRGASRFESFLGRLGLQDRLVNEGGSISVAILMNRPINYEAVNAELEHWRSESENFIKEALAL